MKAKVSCSDNKGSFFAAPVPARTGAAKKKKNTKYSTLDPRPSTFKSPSSLDCHIFLRYIRTKNISMALIKEVRGFTPQFGNNCYLAENATIIGDVVMGDDCSIWFQAVVRGDVHSIRMGNKVNVQDGAIIHCTYKTAPTTIGNNVSIGHRAIVHGCTLKNNILVGMGAIIMDHAVVEDHVLIAAGAVVLEKSHLESGFIYAGVPAKKIKAISEEQFKGTIERISNNYVMYAGWFE
jgi:carbonic anhydrase/acetyltransferase-like protein (isoleucine patch superfamily)